MRAVTASACEVTLCNTLSGSEAFVIVNKFGRGGFTLTEVSFHLCWSIVLDTVAACICFISCFTPGFADAPAEVGGISTVRYRGLPWILIKRNPFPASSKLNCWVAAG